MEILRNPLNLDLYTLVIVSTLVLHIVLRYSFVFEYQNFTSLQRKNPLSGFVIYSISNLTYYALISLMLYPFVQLYYFAPFTYNISYFAYCIAAILIYSFAKDMIKFVWFQAFRDYSEYTQNLFYKAFLQYWKYLITLLFILIFYFSPLKSYFEPMYALYFFLGMYLLEVLFEFIYISPNSFEMGLYKILYLCTLEILPLLVFMKLLFTTN